MWVGRNLHDCELREHNSATLLQTTSTLLASLPFQNYYIIAIQERERERERDCIEDSLRVFIYMCVYIERDTDIDIDIYTHLDGRLEKIVWFRILKGMNVQNKVGNLLNELMYNSNLIGQEIC